MLEALALCFVGAAIGAALVEHAPEWFHKVAAWIVFLVIAGILMVGAWLFGTLTAGAFR